MTLNLNERIPNNFRENVEVKTIDKEFVEKLSLDYLPESFVVLDLETTGLKSKEDSIIEIAAVKVTNHGKQVDEFSTLVKPDVPISAFITNLTGISPEMVDKEGIPLSTAINRLLFFIEDCPIMGYNVKFDMRFIKNALKNLELNKLEHNKTICALQLAKKAFLNRYSYKLTDVSYDFGLDTKKAHRALTDCYNTLYVANEASKELQGFEQGIVEMKTKSTKRKKKTTPAVKSSTKVTESTASPSNKKIVTTQEEMELLDHVLDIIQSDELVAKDTQSYYSVLYQGKSNRWVVRYNVNRKRPTINFNIEINESRANEITRAGLEMTGDAIYLDNPKEILRLAGILKDSFDFVKDDENFKRKK